MFDSLFDCRVAQVGSRVGDRGSGMLFGAGELLAVQNDVGDPANSSISPGCLLAEGISIGDEDMTAVDEPTSDMLETCDTHNTSS